MKITTRRICVVAGGIALLGGLSVCRQVPVFGDYYLCLGYVAMAVYCYSFGAADGTIVGVLGVVLYCLVINGLRGMPGWALGNLVIGVFLGLTFMRTKKLKNAAARTGINAAAIVLSVTVGILIVKSVTECLLYAQPFPVRVGKNLYAWVADMFMLLVSLPIGARLDGVVKKLFPERAEMEPNR